jgi:hypothetical protein
MKRSDIDQPRCYFNKYIDCVDDIELTQAFDDSIAELKSIDIPKWELVGSRAYAEGKWTIKDILQHLIDSERILSYRALRIGRNDKTKLPGFDEAHLAANVTTETRSISSLLEELILIRQASHLLFRSFDSEALRRSLMNNGILMSALAYGFTIIGHQKYHLRMIEDKYLPLI